MKSGMYALGRLKGVRTYDWTTKGGKSGRDTIIGIASYFDDGYGEEKENLTEIKVYTDEITRVASFASIHQGQDVIVGFQVVSKKFGDKAWVEYVFNRNCEIYLAPVEAK